MTTCERAATLSADEWAQIAQIYEESFPPAQRNPWTEVRAEVEAGTLVLFIVRAISGRVAGFALLTAMPLLDSKVFYLPYLAVAAAERGQGLGSRLFQYVAVWAAHRRGEALLWEVEPGDPAYPDDENNRRLRFYQRLGGRVIVEAQHYCMPNLAGEGIVSLWLMWRPLVAWPNPLTRTQIVDWVRALYAVAYPTHPTLAARIIGDIWAYS